MILHIPHSSTTIPTHDNYIDIEALDKSIFYMTDWFTDMIFHHQHSDRMVFPYSRLFCDVERYRDNDKEDMYLKGHGVVYTKGYCGNTIRYISIEGEEAIKSRYYDRHHLALNKMTAKHLTLFDEVVVVDCHSFHPDRLTHENSNERPDICLGVDTTQTPISLIIDMKEYFEQCGLEVLINEPFEGTLIPSNYVGDSRVKGIMIEVNRALYMDVSQNVAELLDLTYIQTIIRGALNIIDKYES